MAKRIVVCCDGAWGVEEARTSGQLVQTNVFHIARAVSPRDPAGMPQVGFYENRRSLDWADVLVNTMPGGLSTSILAAYDFIVDQFQPGDELFLFGFSRGAYVARSTAGLIRTCGVLRPQHRARLTEGYNLYRRRDAAAAPRGPVAQRFRQAYAWDLDGPRIRFIGVWETVGALGIPMGVLWFPVSVLQLVSRRWAFHDLRLSSAIDNAYQALAIDERRAPYAPALWEQQPGASDQVLEQVWFCGSHANVGGGYRDAGLASISLLWMKDKAAQCGLAFDEDYFRQQTVSPDPLGALRDSRVGAFSLFPARWRPIGAMPAGHESIHPSVLERVQARPEYRPPNLLEYLERQSAPAASA